MTRLPWLDVNKFLHFGRVMSSIFYMTPGGRESVRTMAAFSSGMTPMTRAPGSALALALAFGSLDALAGATVEQIVAIDGIGPAVANSVAQFFSLPANQALVQKLKDVGVQPTGQPAAARASDGLSGRTFVLTGSLPNLTREQADVLVHHGFLSLEDLLQAEYSDLADIPEIGGSAGAVIEAVRTEGAKRNLGK
jgi:NAD-dependent DNA ligase